jgi:hypothetical protein
VNRKLIFALPLVLVALLALSGTAAAEPCNPDTNPSCPDPGPTFVNVHLFVNPAPTDGKVTDTETPTGQINCGVGGSDCSQTYSIPSDCFGDCPTETLTASGFSLPGYTARFFSCQTNTLGSTCTGETFCGDGTCTLEMASNLRARVTWLDTTAPTKPALSGPNPAGPSATHFNASGSTDNSGSVAAYRYVLDDVDQGIRTAGFDIPSNLSAGTHHLKARARDASGNESDLSDDFAFTVDRSASVSITSPAAGGHFHDAPTFNFTHDSDAADITCQTLKGSDVVHASACTTQYIPQTDSDGDYTFRVLFTDAVGNTAQDTRAFKIDTGDPNVSITSPTAGQHVKTGFTPAFTATDGGTAAANLGKQCKLDAGAYGACGALTLADGPHTLSVKATDEAGNFREESVAFVADSTGPQVTINSGPPDDSIITTASATYGWSATDASAPLSQTCKLDGGAAAACTSPKTYSGLSEGSHTFTLKVTDALGTSTEVSREVFVNAVRPSVAITSGPAEGSVIKSTSATIGFKAAGGGAVSCSLDSETAYRPCSSATSDTLNNLADGAHTFRVRVKDGSDDTAVASRAFAVDTSVPPPPPPPNVKKILNPSLSSAYDRFPTYTRYRKLSLKRVATGSTITVKCKGKKCPAKSFHKKAHGTVKLSKFMKKKLRPGTKLTIRVTKPGFIGKQFVILIRKSKAPKLTISQIA